MIGTRKRLSRVAAAITAALAPAAASAVSLAGDGLGQALIYPYYTVRASEGGNAFNTYISVGNSTGNAKALRVRLREARAGREAVSFNLYLSPNDMWTGAIVPTSEGARLVTADKSCTDPPFDAGALALRSDQFTDGIGDTLDRTREGYIEMIEMATLTGESAANVNHNTIGNVPGCAAMRANQAPSVAPPTGGLWGTLTLINVASGMDFTLDAVALADLASRPFFRSPLLAYPGFDAAEIDPVSVVTTNGRLYRSVWSRPVDAVSAVLMRSEWMAEYVLDNATASLTDFVVTLPTRHLHLAGQATPPFSTGFGACKHVGVIHYNRGQAGGVSHTDEGPGVPPSSAPTLCSDVALASPLNSAAAHMPADVFTATRTAVFGSTARGLWSGRIRITSGMQNGWMSFRPVSEGPSVPALASLPQSTVVDLATGTVAAGPHTYSGLPVIAFAARTFRNGTLACASGACQGNYGGAFPFTYFHSITAP